MVKKKTFDIKKYINGEVNESYYRLPDEVINNELYRLKKLIEVVHGMHARGDDFQPVHMKTIISLAQKILKKSKKFK